MKKFRTIFLVFVASFFTFLTQVSAIERIPICEQKGVLSAMKILGFLVFGVFKALVPALIVIIGIINLAKVILNGEDDIKKPVYGLVQRFIVGVVIFFIPNFVTAFLSFGIDSFKGQTENSIQPCINCMKDFNNCSTN